VVVANNSAVAARDTVVEYMVEDRKARLEIRLSSSSIVESSRNRVLALSLDDDMF
jgi:hypothetical protein